MSLRRRILCCIVRKGSTSVSLLLSLCGTAAGALASFAAPLVGVVSSRVFGFDGTASVTHDRERDLANAQALGSALLAFMVAPWTMCFLLYTGT